MKMNGSYTSEENDSKIYIFSTFTNTLAIEVLNSFSISLQIQYSKKNSDEVINHENDATGVKSGKENLKTFC